MPAILPMKIKYKKKKKNKSCKDINVIYKSATIVIYLETISDEEFLKVEITKL